MEKYTDLKLELFLKRVVEEAKPMLGEFILGDRPLHAAIFIDGTEFRWKLWKPEERSIKDEIAQALQLLVTNGEELLKTPCTCKETKPECDHIVGLRNIYHITNGIQPGFIEVHDSDIAGKYMMNYLFKDCPECGEKLNLKKDL